MRTPADLGLRRERIAAGSLQIDVQLHRFVARRVLPGLDVDADPSGTAQPAWSARSPRAEQARWQLQAQLDDWHRGQRGRPHDAIAYRSFLEEVGYIVPVGVDFSIDTDRIDREIAGPQLVVPVSNARYSLNAANAR